MPISNDVTGSSAEPQEPAQTFATQHMPEEVGSVTVNELGPSIDVLARRIATLKKKWQDTIAIVCLHRERQMGLVANELDIGYHALSMRMKRIYSTLGINTLEPADKKVLLRQAWARLKEMKDAAQAPQISKGVDPAPKPHVVPAMTAQPTHEPPRNSPSNEFGAGVVIPLPPGLVDVDVVSGLFNGGKPSKDMAEAVRGRKGSGLKPAYLVLSPSGIDPEITLAQLVFFQEEHD